MPLPLPAGPDYPLWMPPDGIMDRTRGAITDHPRAARRAPRISSGEASHQRAGRAEEAGSYRSSISTSTNSHTTPVPRPGVAYP